MIGDIPEALRPLLENAVEQVREPPSSAFEARRRAAGVAEAVIAVLRSEGYYGYTVTPDVDDGPPLRGIVRVETGPRFLILQPEIMIETSGDTGTGSQPSGQVGLQEQARRSLQLANGAPGRAEDILAAEASALGLLRASGYADAEVLPRRVLVDHASRTVQPTFSFNPGPLTRLGGVELIGASQTLPRWLRRLPEWTPGEVFTPARLAALERRILETGAYNGAAVSLAPTDPDQPAGTPRRVLVQLTDKPEALVETELSYSTSEGIGGDVSYSRFNLFGRGDTASIGLRYAQIEQRIEAELRLPHWQRPRQTALFGLEAFRDDTEAFRETGIGVRLDVTRQFSDWSFVSLGGTANINRGREPSFSNPAQGIERNYTALAVRAAFALDRTDNRLNPLEGYRLDGVFEPISLTGDANLVFARLQTQITGYVTPAERLTLAARGNVASLLGGSIPEIPSARRLYAGGGGSVRGYEYQGIGPRYNDADRTPVGGLSLVEVSGEVRYRFENSRFGMVTFVDAGTLSDNQVPDLTDIRYSAGLGVRYFLDFAPIRFDVAVPLDSRRGSDDVQIYIGVGQGF
ncbi:MAG: autotransporter assembly complex protein TamA [Hyphomonadaceae bacterium]|nr:autotransporter assembly complex protein TamA [Hyphomonadaceae bacterium]